MRNPIRQVTQQLGRQRTHDEGPCVDESALRPTVTRIDRDIELVAPPGCSASVVLKFVGSHDGSRYYTWWAVAGRDNMDTVAIRFRYSGEDTIRFDLPEGMPLSAESLQPHLATYLASVDPPPPQGKPPIIRE
jgi:hypothetical protein